MAKSMAPAAPSLVANTTLAPAITALSAEISALRPPLSSIMKPQVLDPFSYPSPFDISSRSGATSYNVPSSSLDQIWDGPVATFLSFIILIPLRANKG